MTDSLNTLLFKEKSCVAPKTLPGCLLIPDSGYDFKGGTHWRAEQHSGKLSYLVSERKLGIFSKIKESENYNHPA
jgi:hypothetical protein